MNKQSKFQTFHSMQPKHKKKEKRIDSHTVDNSDCDDNTLSAHSALSIDPNESFVNDIAHNLFILAVQQAREERRVAKLRQQNKKRRTITGRQSKLIKKAKLTIDDIDRVFEEKRLRPPTIKSDLYDLYQKSSGRIRSMLDIHQIDRFIQAKQNRELV